MAEFASKGVAGAGLGLGIAGTALGLLNGGLGNLGLGGLCGGACHGARAASFGMGSELQYVSELQAKVQALEAEKTSNTNLVSTFNQTVANDKELRGELYAFIKPLAEEAANKRVNIARLEEQQKCCRENQDLREQILEGKLREQALALNGKIDTVAQSAGSCG